MVLHSAAFAAKELRYHERHDTNEFLAKQTTVVEQLQDGEVPPNQIIQITGHKKLQSVDNYSSLREKQMDNISHILSSTSKAVT